MSRLYPLYVSLILSIAASAVAAPAEPPPKIPKELLEKRVEAASKAYLLKKTRIQNANGLPAELFGWSERWLESELALRDKKSERVQALRDHLDRTREVERFAAAQAQAGQGLQADADAATYFRLEAEIRLVKEGVKPHPAKGKP